jgi:hypothetical protein
VFHVEHSQFDSYMGERAEHERWRQEGLREFRPLREVESELLLHAEELCQGNRKEMAKILGYFNYYAVPGNLTSLGVFRVRVLVLWWRALRRRSQKHRISWTRTLTLARRWLPPPHVLHSFPDARFAATYLR